ncbi:hypothetical protein C8R44DRAFT_754890 [Mycena epipterygia]|nr:hypothetical protein C8R44DRAFT_754890 [Mycena epipterygia]
MHRCAGRQLVCVLRIIDTGSAPGTYGDFTPHGQRLFRSTGVCTIRGVVHGELSSLCGRLCGSPPTCAGVGRADLADAVQVGVVTRVWEALKMRRVFLSHLHSGALILEDVSLRFEQWGSHWLRLVWYSPIIEALQLTRIVIPWCLWVRPDILAANTISDCQDIARTQQQNASTGLLMTVDQKVLAKRLELSNRQLVRPQVAGVGSFDLEKFPFIENSNLSKQKSE